MRSTLTTREWQIVELLGDGASTEQIMERLVLSPSTVYSHIYRLLRKLGVHSRREAVVAARRLRQAEASTGAPCGSAGVASGPIASARDAYEQVA
jgi:ATP/maltotriose-dependent transcriptional regulator MalT